MRLRKVLALRGPNVWANFPVLEAWGDLEGLKDAPSDEIPGFNDRLKAWLPSMVEHRCSVGTRGGFFERLARGTYQAHILEHVALELQCLAGTDVGFGRARETAEDGVSKVAIEFEEEELGLAAVGRGWRSAWRRSRIAPSTWRPRSRPSGPCIAGSASPPARRRSPGRPACGGYPSADWTPRGSAARPGGQAAARAGGAHRPHRRDRRVDRRRPRAVAVDAPRRRRPRAGRRGGPGELAPSPARLRRPGRRRLPAWPADPRRDRSGPPGRRNPGGRRRPGRRARRGGRRRGGRGPGPPPGGSRRDGHGGVRRARPGDPPREGRRGSPSGGPGDRRRAVRGRRRRADSLDRGDGGERQDDHDAAHRPNPSARAAVVDPLGMFPHERRVAVCSADGDRTSESIVRQGEVCGDGFDRVILYEDRNLRGRAEGEIFALLRRGLAGGRRARSVEVVVGEQAAIARALADLAPGDLVVFQVDEDVHLTCSLVEAGLSSIAGADPLGPLPAPPLQPVP